MRLTRETVLLAALELLNEVGMDELTTRRLAQRLGIQSPTLYWHFRNKRALLDAMAEQILLLHHQQALMAPGGDWRLWLRDNARSFRRGLLAYRDGARLHAGTKPSQQMLPWAERQLQVLCEAGFTPATGLAVMIAMSRYVVGWVLEEQASAADAADRGDAVILHPDPQAYPLLAAGIVPYLAEDGDTAFDRAIGFFIAGLRPEEASSDSEGSGIQTRQKK